MLQVVRTSKCPKGQVEVEVESAVKTDKQILRRPSDPYLGLLVYRKTPLTYMDFSPVQPLMGRSLRDTLHQTLYQMSF